MKRFTAVLLLFLANENLATIVTECDNLPLPRKVQINDCDGPICIIYNGDVAEAKITLDIDRDIDDLSPAAYFQMPGVGPYFPYTFLPDYDACANLAYNRCPLEAGERITYTLRIPMSDFPQISVNLKIHVNSGTQDAVKETLTCFGFTVSVKNPPGV